MASRDLKTNIKVQNALNIGSITTNTTTAGVEIDTQGYESVTFEVITGARTDGTVTPLIQESDTSGSYSGSVSDDDLVQVNPNEASSESFWKTDADALKDLKNTDGIDLQVHGSGNLIQTLMQHDLVDEFWLKIFPVTLGTGKRLFDTGTIPASFTLTESKTSPSGVIFANFKRTGEVKTGSF